MDKIDGDELTEYVLESVKFPQKSIRSAEKVRQMREQRAANQQELIDAEMAERAAKVVPGLGKQIEKGSPLELAGAMKE